MKAIMRENEKMICSNSSWMGHLPIDWQMPKLLYVLREKISDGPHETPEYVDNGIPFISIDSLNDTKSINLQDCKRYITEEDYIRFSQKTRIEKDDILFSKAATIGKTAIIKDEKIMVWSPLAIIKANSNMINNNYLYHVLNCDKLIIDVSLSGSMNTQINVGMRELEHVKIPLPPFKEQQLIANYLDDRCSKIDAIIAEAKASIEEYKELKQAVITQAVTLGIKKNRSLKDTNILWIGKMPCEWQLAELKFFASIKSGITLGQKYPAGAKLVEMPYLRVANVQGEYVDLSDVKTIQVLPEEVDKYRLEAGVVLMTEGGDRDKLGRGCVWHGEITPCLHQNHIFALTTKSDKLLPEYFSHVTTSEVARCYFDYTAKKTTNLANTNSSTIMNFRLPIPPIEEQREIVQYLDKRIKTLNDMISEKQSLIEDLEAYKKSLIYEVVTGKRKVVA